MKKSILLLSCLLILTGSLFSQEVILKKDKYVSKSSGKLFTGVFKEYDDEGHLTYETTIKNGVLNGQTVVYFPNGSKKEIRSYVDGKKEGVWNTWTDRGVKTAEASFKDGKKEGTWIVWDEQGVKRYEMFYRNGEKAGTWIIWDESGKEVSREEF